MTEMVELVRVTTADGVRLDGAWHAPSAAVAPSACDGLLLVLGRSFPVDVIEQDEPLAQPHLGELRGAHHGFPAVRLGFHDLSGGGYPHHE